jgi:hypothetical protein
MATEYISVPVDGNKNEIDGWLENISQFIDAGSNVEFRDRQTGADINLSRIQLDSAGSVCIWGAGYNSSAAQSITLTAGEFHTIGGIHGVRADGTGTGKGIHTKI